MSEQERSSVEISETAQTDPVTEEEVSGNVEAASGSEVSESAVGVAEESSSSAEEQEASEGAAQGQKRRGQRRRLVGVVVSDKMDKTIVVMVERRKAHPLYKKYYTRRKKFLAHDEQNECRVGDVVQIMETRPLSRRKRWRLVKILERGQQRGGQ